MVDEMSVSPDNHGAMTDTWKEKKGERNSMNDAFELMENMGADVQGTLDRLQIDEETYTGYIKFFFDSIPLKALKIAIDQCDFQSAEREAHSLKGVTLNLGLLPVADLSIDMLKLYREGKPEEASALFPEIEMILLKLETCISENIN